MNYWVRLIIQVGGGLASYVAISRVIKPVQTWIKWLIWIFALNGGVVLIAEQLIKTLGWNEIYTRLALETIGIGVVLALMPRHLMKKNKPAATAVEPVKEERPALKKRKKPKF